MRLSPAELAARRDRAIAALSACCLCGWECKKDRLSGKRGVCLSGRWARLHSYGPDLDGAYPPLHDARPGIVTFSSCSLRCQFCRHWQEGQDQAGEEIPPERLAEIMLELQAQSCQSLVFVSPTHVIPQILEALVIAVDGGLHLPLAYNSSGYDTPEALRLLDGVIDAYLPEMKYASPRIALTYSKIRNYPQINRAAVKEMYRQVGDWRSGADDALHGLLVRHLVLPNDLGGTSEITRWLAKQISAETQIEFLTNYYPAWNAKQFPKLNRQVRADEANAILQLAQEVGLTHVYKS
jgi:putative pyruvate formate lyase activating enzyme